MNEFLSDFEKLSKQRPRYFPHSQTHTLKQRYLIPLVFCDKISESIKNILMHEIQYQTNQSNICYLIEIILANYFVSQKNADELIDILASDNNLKAPNVQSLFAIIFIFCCSMNDKELAKKAVATIFSYSMGQNFSTRLFSQITVLQLIKRFQLDDLKMIQESIEISFQSGNAAKHFSRIIDDFRYTSLNYDRLLTVDVAYHHLPRLGGVCEDEIITYELYKEVSIDLGCGFPDLKDSSLEHISVVSETRNENLVLGEELTIITDNKCDSGTNLQQKIIPIKWQLPDQSLLATVPSTYTVIII